MIKIKLPVCLLLTLMLICTPLLQASANPPTVSTVVPGNIYIPATTLINCELVTHLNSGKSKVGDRVIFKTTENIVINNVIAIPKGSSGEGIVTKASGAGAFGKGGTIEMKAKFIKAINNVEVPVAFEKREGGGGKNGWVVPAFLVVTILAGFINGSNIDLPSGTQFQTTVVNDTDLGGTAADLKDWVKNNTVTVSNSITSTETKPSDNGLVISKANASSNTKTYPEIMTIEQVADYLQISSANVQQLIDEGKIRTISVGNNIRIKKSDVDAYLG